ncbi:hypothetical protein TRFO_35830 [Tritrichomonas foetus]|uniref:Leucine Rich Repeat family protein n=1 Tax=Tritrichomonas foetus TaxID=1144522 RepID=A0A1J4JF84_9EUKA|nr:hypothetical protein TRFO_35830 [Tritrichomonas foetus]|eukprot:OHS97870.1 hypothetical protein TRFO_35830 [Tritrichomonas foetus]
MIDSELVDLVPELLENNSEMAFFARWVEEISSKQQVNRRLIILSDSGLSVCSSKSFTKTPTRNKFLSWFDLKRLNLIQSDTLKFYFLNNEKSIEATVAFITEDPRNVIDLIGQHLVNILNPDEYPNIDIPNFRFSDFSPSIFRSLLHLMAKALADYKFSDDIISLVNTYHLFLESGSSCLNTGIFQNSKYLDLIFDTLNFAPQITSVVFPQNKSTFSHWPNFLYLLKRSRYIQNVITNEIIDDKFSILQSFTKENYKGVFNSIGFNCPKMTQNEFDIAIKLIENLGIHNITFGSLTPRFNSVKLLNNFHNLYNNISSLTLDHITKINFPLVLQTFKNLTHLGVTFCKLELSKVLSFICAQTNYTIESFDFAGNIYSTPINITNRVLPKNVKKLGFNNVEFYGITLQILFEFLINQKRDKEHQISISLSNLKIDDQVLSSFFQYLLSYCKNAQKLLYSPNYGKNDFQCNSPNGSQKNLHLHSFCELEWDNNDTYYPIIPFCSQSNTITKLSLNGSINENDNNLIQYLISFIACNKTCTELNIAGSIKHSFSSHVLNLIFQAIKLDNRVIKRLNLRNHSYDNANLDSLADALMSNRNIEYINFSNNGIHDKSVWHRFFSKLTGRGKPLDFPIPIAEFSNMASNGKITTPEIEEIMKMIYSIKKGSSDVNIPQNTIECTNYNDDVAHFEFEYKFKEDVDDIAAVRNFFENGLKIETLLNDIKKPAHA